MKNGVIIPCYNEAGRLKTNAFLKFIDTHPDYIICFVNDGSKDNTIEILNKMKAHNPTQILVCDLEQNSGKAEAVRLGTLYTLKITKADNIGFLDADLATGFDDYKRLVETLKETNGNIAAIGSRRSIKNDNIKRSFHRAFVSQIIGWLIQMVIQLPIRDTQCGAKVFQRQVAKQIFAQAFITKWIFDIELLIRMKNSFNVFEGNNRIEEVPLNKWEDVEGSKLTMMDGLKVPLQLTRLYIQYTIFPIFDQIVSNFLNTFNSIMVKNPVA